MIAGRNWPPLPKSAQIWDGRVWRTWLLGCVAVAARRAVCGRGRAGARSFGACNEGVCDVMRFDWLSRWRFQKSQAKQEPSQLPPTAKEQSNKSAQINQFNSPHAKSLGRETTSIVAALVWFICVWRRRQFYQDGQKSPWRWWCSEFGGQMW